MGWLLAKLQFKLMQSIKICIRGSKARNAKEMKKIMLMIQTILNTFMTSAPTKNKHN